MKCVIAVLLLIGCGLFFFKIVEGSPPRVTTPLGTIEGHYKVSSNGRQFEAYEGVPYASPPTGESRFRVPRPVQPWKGVLTAKQVGSSCTAYTPDPGQEPPGHVTGSEDCLYMNIYTANRDAGDQCYPTGIINGATHTNLLPVIFFIHGGAFQFGSGNSHGPKYLLDRNVTLVTINHRLGPLGFLSTEDGVVPGNMGLKDQVMALRWVKNNIRYFGGDPSKVTIVGQSAGGASVQYHMLSNLSRGLFHRGMSISGTALDCWAQTEGSLEKAKKLATIVGCPSQDVQSMVDCLRTRPADQITRAIGDFMRFLYNPYTPFGPVVEKGDVEPKFIHRPPMETLISGEVPQDVPWITSVVSEEGLYTAGEFITRDNLLNELNENWETLAPHLLDFNYTIPKNDHAAVAQLIRQHYLGTSPINRSTVNQTVQMVGDRWFVYDAEKAARHQARANRSPVRVYYFSYRGAHSLSEEFSGSTENFGVSHVDDEAYVMDSIFDPTTTERDREMQQVMIDLWVSFATNGIPDAGVQWSKLGRSQGDKFRYLHIAGPNEISMESSSNFGQKKFWQTIGLRENVQ